MGYLDDRGLAHFWQKLKGLLANKVDKVSGKGLSANDYTAAEKEKLAGIAAGANKTTVDASLSSTSANPVQNKAVYSALSGKVDQVSGKGLSTNDYTTTEKNKLAGIAAGANNYVHPTTAGNKHIPAGGSSGQILRWSAAGTAVWGADQNTTYSNMTGASSSAAGASGLVPAPAAGTANRYLRSDGTWAVPPDNNTTYANATTSAAGLMSASDKTKLNGIATGANKTTVDTSLSSTSANPIQNKAVHTALAGKVDKVSGKALSTNDFTDAYQSKLDSVYNKMNLLSKHTAAACYVDGPVKYRKIAEATYALPSSFFRVDYDASGADSSNSRKVSSGSVIFSTGEVKITNTVNAISEEFVICVKGEHIDLYVQTGQSGRNYMFWKGNNYMVGAYAYPYPEVDSLVMMEGPLRDSASDISTFDMEMIGMVYCSQKIT